jgi:hypothetical protein
MLTNSVRLTFFVTEQNLKEAKKRLGSRELYIVDISKIIRDLGYSVCDLTPESEFVINFSVMKKIQQGIYNTKSKDILVINKEMSDGFMEGLQFFLDGFVEIDYEIDLLE